LHLWAIIKFICYVCLLQCINKVTNSIDQRPSSEGYTRIPYLLCSQKVHYLVHKSLPLDSIMSLSNPVHTPTPCFYKRNLNFPSMTWPFKWLFPSGFPTKILFMFLISTCMLHAFPILLSFDHPNNVFGEECKL